ncbi:MAG: hypothetical protein K8R88_03420 [Armatimonadetes bacterium]|nr:hypothetical protein [Armatimonadota bacterium]
MAEKEVYSEQEVTEIIQHAVAIQEEGLAKGELYKSGVTRSELERIAAEVGVSPEALAKALQRTDPDATPKSIIRFRESFRRVVNGELDPNDFDLVVQSTHPMHQSRRHNSVQQIGRTLNVQSWTGAGSANVTVASRDGRTNIDVTSSPILPIMMSFYPSFITAAVMGPVISIQNPIVGAVSAIALLAGGAFGTLKLLAKNHFRSRELADKLTDAVEQHVKGSLRENLATSSAEVKNAEVQPKINVSSPE